jgi:hypothetical protein
MSNRTIQIIAIISLIVFFLAVLLSCKKEAAPHYEQPLPASPLIFNDTTYYRITAHYNEQGELSLPETMGDDSILFTYPEAMHISTLDPCRTTYVYWRTYREGMYLKLEWFDIVNQWKPVTFIVLQSGDGKFFTLKNGNTYTKYSKL